MEELSNVHQTAVLRPENFFIFEVLALTVYKDLLMNKSVSFTPAYNLTHQLQNCPLAVFSHHY